MATNRRLPMLAACWLAGVAAPVAAQVTGAIDEIVVTAQKVEQRSIDVPISLLVFNRDFFSNTRTITFEDLGRLSPSLFVNESVGSSYTNVAIRGIGSDALNSGVEPSVGVFVDGVYQGRPAFLASDLADVERVEILRGPQGTLYGKNSSAGAINVLTRRPGERLEANGRAYYGNFSSVNLEAGIGGPLAAGVRARVSAYLNDRDGYIRNDIAATGGDSYKRFGVKGVLEADVSPALTLTLRAAYDSHRASIINYGLLQASPDLAGAAGAFGVTLPSDIFDYRASANFRPRERITQFRTSLTADWDLGGSTLTSITAYQQFRDNNLTDVDYTGLDLLDGGSITSQDQVSQELRIASDPGKRFSWLAGVFAFRQTQDDFGFNTVRPDLSLITGGFFPAGAQDVIESDSSVRTLAAFGQASYQLADALTATLGIRVDNQRNKTRRRQPAGVTLPGLGSIALSKTDSDVSGTASLRYAFAEDAQVYATVSRGYKGGGYNGFGVPSVDAIGFDPEQVINYEAGLKGRFLDRRLVVEVSGFVMKIDDLQVSNFDGTNFIVGNAAVATSKGVEFNVTAEPAEGLVFGVSGTWNDAQYDRYPGAPCTAAQSAASGGGTCTQDLAGRTIANAPRFRGVVSAQYGRQIEGLGLGLFGRVDYSRTGKQYLNTALARETLQGAYGVLNARIGIEGPARRWGVYATAANLTDSQYLRNAYDYPLFGGAFLAAPSRPRTYGVELQFNY